MRCGTYFRLLTLYVYVQWFGLWLARQAIHDMVIIGLRWSPTEKAAEKEQKQLNREQKMLRT